MLRCCFLSRLLRTRAVACPLFILNFANRCLNLRIGPQVPMTLMGEPNDGDVRLNIPQLMCRYQTLRNDSKFHASCARALADIHTTVRGAWNSVVLSYTRPRRTVRTRVIYDLSASIEESVSCVVLSNARSVSHMRWCIIHMPCCSSPATSFHFQILRINFRPVVERSCLVNKTNCGTAETACETGDSELRECFMPRACVIVVWLIV